MKKELSYFQIKNFDELNERKVIIFGASNGGNIAFDRLLKSNVKEENILFFCDNNFKEYKNEIEVCSECRRINKKIVTPNELKEYCKNHKETIIIIATLTEKFCIQIKEQLKKLDIENTIIFLEEIIFFRRTLCNIQNLKTEIDKMEIYKESVWENYKARHRYEFYEGLLEDINKLSQFVYLLLPPKTGSSTVYKSIQCSKMQLCFVTKEHSLWWMLPEDFINWKKHIKKVIIGVREPIAGNISYTFAVKKAPSLHTMGWLNPQDVFNHYVVGSILNPIKRRNEKQYGFEEVMGAPMLLQSWFEDQLKLYLDIDIYDYPFDKETGYQIIKIDGCEILLYRLESINSLEKVFGEFLNIKDFKFVRDNEASSKWYNESYRNFLKNVTMPQEYIDISYNSKYMKHFYTEEEISKFREKWEKHVDPNWSIQGE